MMKIAASLCALLGASATAAASNTFTPPRLAYQELENLLLQDGEITKTQQEERYQLKSILQEVGLFSITDIPGMGHFKPQTFEYLVPCIQEDKELAAKHTFADGTLRQTLATIPGKPIWEEETPYPCDALEKNSQPFRGTVAEVSRTVAELLKVLSGLEEPLLRDAQGGSFDLESIVNEGQHLEHFHVYSTAQEEGTKNTTTLDWHTDQGLMLLFSPGIKNGEPTHHDFSVQLPDGPKAVEFSHKDELVVMLGEGVHQYVNPHLKDQAWRAVPHSLSVQEGPRAWYGLMVLPPSNALHPTQRRTFGELRQEQILNPLESASFGCGNADAVTSEDRILQETEESCQLDSQQYCWHRCMNFTEMISPGACEAADATHEVACINSERQLWTGDHNPDFTLGCIDVETADEAPALETESPAESSGNETEQMEHTGDEGHSEEAGEHMDDKEEDAPSTAGARQTGWVSVGAAVFAAMMSALYM